MVGDFPHSIMQFHRNQIFYRKKSGECYLPINNECLPRCHYKHIMHALTNARLQSRGKGTS